MNDRLVLSKDIYDGRSVRKAIKEYSDICHIGIDESESAIYLDFTNAKYDITETIREFENYLIQLSVSGKNNYAYS